MFTRKHYKHNCSVIGGYTHWTEIKEISNYHCGLAYNIVGL